MGALFGRRWIGRTRPAPRGELALDLDPAGVTIYERQPDGAWEKFAGADPGDPLFATVIGLLRAEAEERCGRRPVWLWLPADQVLRIEGSLPAHGTARRLAAAFALAERATGLPARDLAIAVGPEDTAGRTPVLVTHAETCREAVAHARRWGFLPGPVSTRHRAHGFAGEPPIFQLAAEIVERVPPSGFGDHRHRRREHRRGAVRRLLLAALLLAAVVAALILGGAGARGQTRSQTAAATAPLFAPLPPARLARPARMAPVQRADDPGQIPPPLPAIRPHGRRHGPLAARPIAASRDDMALVGVMELAGRREALIRAADGDFRAVKASDTIAGWRVRAVKPDSVELARGGQRRTLHLVTP